MTNIHPLFTKAIAPFAPSPQRLFTVSVVTSSGHEETNLSAENSCDAITEALKLRAGGDDDAPADHMVVSVRPMRNLPGAA